MSRKEINKQPIAIVGAGPGDVELITIKGRRLLDEAECIVYAGSLVNKKLLEGCKADIHDSQGMNLDEIITILSTAWKKGQRVVRLHTGDPSIFGAIKEQMQQLDALQIPYRVVPGVSSAFGAAAALNAELTLPEVAQTVIITRQEGRTPVPELEKLQLLASHQTTMLIFLSVSMMDKVVEELIAGGYPEDTPVAIVEKATWDDETILTGSLKSIAAQVEQAGIRKTAMICVGRVFANTDLEAVSKLYDRSFSHGTRKAN
ncbi:cobalt-precorrin 4 C11-methyltransferase [Desulfocapsa sulfexigens DSM 10523]|uniref:Cobalt-precorrin 4 C11-methyltransferase n=1 Tax=Desulfocapsa sulfexigens (strain DSM 10523 / SB164P1) TaxID=1167006 RepID=M1PJP7_DESSD|nr:precorrin-4 C(11)-methyltransferase [Desulfocapsa sulfexigens]AGF79780.1 cobalt-precorrin 4 C11-methyltransferase [Desulfocapsa sulfexigens DSM 10523]